MAGAERAIQYAVEKLGQLLIDEIIFLNEVRDGIDWMCNELRWMRGFLEDADAKAKNGDERTKIWIKDVTNIAQEAEDVVDTFMYKIDINNTQKNGLFRWIAGTPIKYWHLHNIGNEILQIKTKIHTISERKERYRISNIGEPSGSAEENFRVQRNLNPYLCGNKCFVGFEGHENFILERLIDPQVKKCVAVPIVGMGGLGKTTLATMIYNSDVVKDWFSYHAWVTVSEEFKPLELLRSLLSQIMWNSENFNNMDTTELIQLKVQVHECLKKKRYLVVIDDIWEQDPDVWTQLKDAFPDVGNGSRVLITSRFIGVGKSIDPNGEPYTLPFLGGKESWELFLNVVFPSKDDSKPECPEELKILGKDLVGKCGGLPLGVKILGGLLSVTDATIDAWNKVAIKWKYQHSRLQILALSYHHLPNINLKSCFLYIGNYPEDHVIRASELTKFWIAEGFILKDENQTFEETAKDYLNEFVSRCMVQVVDRTRTSKRVKHLRIHDLFRKWCVSEAQEDGFFRICTSSSDTSIPQIIAARRLTVYTSTLDDKFYDLSFKARAILGFNYLSVGNFLSSKIGQNFKLLRVIYLEFPENVNIPKSNILKDISNLIHLRNITLKSNALKYLPNSIGELHNLQTLNIRSTCISKLPVTIYKIENLRHLYTRGVRIKTSVDWNARNLHTLDSIIAGSWMLKVFTKLSNLRKLSISRITGNEVLCLQDSLHQLVHLKSLRLETDDRASATSLFTSFRNHNPLSKLVLINWNNVSSKFPQNLISIRLSGCAFEKGVIASLEKLPSLANLHLDGCSIYMGDEFVFSANGFQQLENLHIGEKHFLLNWRIKEGALPKIKCLMISALDWVGMFSSGLEHLKSLLKVEIDFPKKNLQRRLPEILEDLHKIPQITSVKLNGTPLDEYKRSYGRNNVGDDERIIIGQTLEECHNLECIQLGRTEVSYNRKTMRSDDWRSEATLEVKGLNPRYCAAHGVDFVTVLDVGQNNLKILKSAMEFLIGKLRPIDRLSIVICSSKPVKLCPLRQITKGSLVDIEILVNNLAFGYDRNVTAGIRMGLEVINCCRFTTGRLAAIMFMSDDNLSGYDHSTAPVQLGGIPVYTFGLGEHCDHTVMNEISNASLGGKFSFIHNSDEFSVAFTQCFAALFGVAVQDLKLTLKPFLHLQIESVFAGYCKQFTDSISGSVTIIFGDLYVGEVRRVTVIILTSEYEVCVPEYLLQLISSDAEGEHKCRLYFEKPFFVDGR